jgi:hypothetical protein
VPSKYPWRESKEHDVRIGQVRKWVRNENTFFVAKIIKREVDPLEDEVEIHYSDGFTHTMYATDMIKLFADDDSYSIILCEP